MGTILESPICGGGEIIVSRGSTKHQAPWIPCLTGAQRLPFFCLRSQLQEVEDKVGFRQTFQPVDMLRR